MLPRGWSTGRRNIFGFLTTIRKPRRPRIRWIQHELLRITQEAISNAVRHAKPTVVNVTLRWNPPNLILKVKDNGSGISSASREKSEGFGLGNMRTRASKIDGKLDIHTTVGHGTSIVLAMPIAS